MAAGSSNVNNEMKLLEIATAIGRIESNVIMTNDGLKEIKHDLREVSAHVNDLRSRMQVIEPMVHEHANDLSTIKTERANVSGGISVVKFLWYIVPIVVSWIGGVMYLESHYDISVKTPQHVEAPANDSKPIQE